MLPLLLLVIWNRFDCSSVSLQATSIAGDPAEALCNDTKDCKLPRHFLQGHWFLFMTSVSLSGHILHVLSAPNDRSSHKFHYQSRERETESEREPLIICGQCGACACCPPLIDTIIRSIFNRVPRVVCHFDSHWLIAHTEVERGQTTHRKCTVITLNWHIRYDYYSKHYGNRPAHRL